MCGHEAATGKHRLTKQVKHVGARGCNRKTQADKTGQTCGGTRLQQENTG